MTDINQPQPGPHQQRAIVTPTGQAPGYRLRRVKSLPPGGQIGDEVWDESQSAICVWDGTQWVCWPDNCSPLLSGTIISLAQASGTRVLTAWAAGMVWDSQDCSAALAGQPLYVGNGVMLDLPIYSTFYTNIGPIRKSNNSGLTWASTGQDVVAYAIDDAWNLYIYTPTGDIKKSTMTGGWTDWVTLDTGNPASPSNGCAIAVSGDGTHIFVHTQTGGTTPTVNQRTSINSGLTWATFASGKRKRNWLAGTGGSYYIAPGAANRFFMCGIDFGATTNAIQYTDDMGGTFTGATMTPAASAGHFVATVINKRDSNWGNNSVCLLYNQVAKTVQVYITTDNGLNWTSIQTISLKDLASTGYTNFSLDYDFTLDQILVDCWSTSSVGEVYLISAAFTGASTIAQIGQRTFGGLNSNEFEASPGPHFGTTLAGGSIGDSPFVLPIHHHNDDTDGGFPVAYIPTTPANWSGGVDPGSMTDALDQLAARTTPSSISSSVSGGIGRDGEDGIDGFPGPPGPVGATGATGPQGPQGIPGFDGQDGDDGPPGPPGIAGAAGSTGATGPQGPQGIPGFDGVDGDQGPPGPQGNAGTIGVDGAAGAMGLMGPMGADGEEGPMGFPGPSGIAGPAGASGPPGIDGQDASSFELLPVFNTAAHAIHEEVAAALTYTPDLHFMGAGVFAWNNAGRTEVIIPTIFDGIVDSNDTNAAGKGNVYSTIQAAITAGHKTVVLRNCTDASDIIIGLTVDGSTSGNNDNLQRLIGYSAQGADCIVNVTSLKDDVQFEYLKFNGKSLTFGNQGLFKGDRCTAFACFFTGAVTSTTGLLNGAITSATVSIPWDTPVGAMPLRGMVLCEYEVFGYASGGGGSSGTFATNASARGAEETLADSHVDNTPFTSLMQASLVINNVDCQALQCRFIGCSTPTAQCLLITGLGDRARITSNIFSLNSTWSCIFVAPQSSSATNQPVGIQVVSNEFDRNTCYSYVLEVAQADGNPSNEPRNSQVAGNLFRQYNGGGVKLASSLWNVAGNTFDGGAALADASQVLFNQPAYTNVGGTVTYPTATTLQDTAAVWEVNQWIGHVVTSGAVTATVTSNTATVLTFTGGWSGATPGAGASFTIAAGMTTTQTTIPFDTFTGGVATITALPAKGVVFCGAEEIIYSGKTTTALFGCIRGANGTTAATATDNAVMTNYSQRAISGGRSNVGVGSLANLFSGNSFASTKIVYMDVAIGNRPRATFTTNQMFRCTFLFCSSSALFVGNGWVTMTVDVKSQLGVYVFGGNPAVTFTNLASDTAVYLPNKPNAGLSAAFTFPTGQGFAWGRVAGDLSPGAVPLINRTGALSVVGHAVIIDIANATSYKESVLVGGNDPLKIGVVIEAVANLATGLVATEGVVTVTAVANAGGVGVGVAVGDIITTDVTAGLVKVNNVAALGVKLGRAITAVAAAGGAFTMLVEKN